METKNVKLLADANFDDATQQITFKLWSDEIKLNAEVKMPIALAQVMSPEDFDAKIRTGLEEQFNAQLQALGYTDYDFHYDSEKETYLELRTANE